MQMASHPKGRSTVASRPLGSIQSACVHLPITAAYMAAYMACRHFWYVVNCFTASQLVEQGYRLAERNTHCSNERSP